MLSLNRISRSLDQYLHPESAQEARIRQEKREASQAVLAELSKLRLAIEQTAKAIEDDDRERTTDDPGSRQ